MLLHYTGRLAAAEQEGLGKSRSQARSTRRAWRWIFLDLPCRWGAPWY